jgi:putative copper export protein
VIRVYAAVSLLVGVLALGLWAQAQRTRAVAAEAALAGARAQLAQVQEAAAVHRAHLARMERERAAQAVLADEFDQLEGGDAPLSDYLRAVDGRLR